MSIITITLPYAKRHLTTEIKARGGRFHNETKTWSLPSTEENRTLADLIAMAPQGATVEERVFHITETAVALLNSIGHRRYRAVESGDRVVIVSEPAITKPASQENA